MMKEGGSRILTKTAWHLLATSLCSHASATGTQDEEGQQRWCQPRVCFA